VNNDCGDVIAKTNNYNMSYIVRNNIPIFLDRYVKNSAGLNNQFKHYS